jgi:hypothetical protein
MLIPVGGAEVLVGGLDRLTCKDKGRTMGFPGGPPPTPKLDEVYFERERESSELVSKKKLTTWTSLFIGCCPQG